MVRSVFFCFIYVATHKPHDDRAFLHRARFLQAVAGADVVLVDVHARVACDGDHHIIGVFARSLRNTRQPNV